MEMSKRMDRVYLKKKENKDRDKIYYFSCSIQIYIFITLNVSNMLS